MATTISLAQAEDKLLALFSTGGLIVMVEQFLQGQSDPRYQAAAGVLVSIGVLLKAVVSTTPAPPAPTLYVKNPDGTFSPKSP